MREVPLFSTGLTRFLGLRITKTGDVVRLSLERGEERYLVFYREISR